MIIMINEDWKFQASKKTQMPHKFNKSDQYDLRVMFQAFWNIQHTNSFVDIDD